MTARTQVALSNCEKEQLRTVRKVSLHEARNVPAPKECEPDAGLFPAKDTEEIDLFLKVTTYCLKIFPEKRKKVLELMLQDKSEKEIGSIMGIARSTVNQHTRRVKRSLTHYFKNPSMMKK